MRLQDKPGELPCPEQQQHVQERDDEQEEEEQNDIHRNRVQERCRTRKAERRGDGYEPVVQTWEGRGNRAEHPWQAASLTRREKPAAEDDCDPSSCSGEKRP